jgi:hypothetical protein
MGEKLFDDLARALVEPVPRSRALRLMGSVLVATSLPGAAFARSRRPSRTAFRCFVKDGFGGQSCCPGDICCGTKACCNPKTQRCVRGTCQKCARMEKCGPTCCPKGNDCCYRPLNAKPSRPESLRRVCCKPPNVCQAGTCRCPSGAETCDGKRCCKASETCAWCVTEDERNAAPYVGFKCCPKSKPFCCGSTCCEVGNCCGKKCCPAETQCARPKSGGDLVCCPSERATQLDEGWVCCPEGLVGVADGCCPPGQDYC